MITAKFGSKSFEVSANKIYTPDGIPISESLSTEEVEVSGKKPTLNIKGIGLLSISFDVSLNSIFLDVESELDYWTTTLRNKTSQVLSIGKRTLGYFFLTDCSHSDVVLAKDGSYIKAKLSLSFKEDSTKKVVTQTPTPPKTQTVTQSPTTTVSKSITVGTTVKPKANTRWYYTAEGAINRTGTSGVAYQQNIQVSHVYNNGQAIALGVYGWMIPSDVTVV